MRRFAIISKTIIFSLFILTNVFYSQETTIVAPTNEVGENLDLYAVMEVFKESESVEAFEKALNDPDKNLNNLDLNGDGEVDYIRVVEEGDDQARVFILQAVVGEDLYQDVATIEVEKKDDEEWVAQAIGAQDVYGPNYIVEPAPSATVRVNVWPIVVFAWSVHYVRWHSPYYWRHYPPYYRPWRPYPVHVYRGRVTVYHRGATFHHTTVRRTVHTQSVYRTRSGQYKSSAARTKPVTTQKQPKTPRTANTKDVNKSVAKTPKTGNSAVNKTPKSSSGAVNKAPKTTNQKSKISQTGKPATKNTKVKTPSNKQNKSAVKKPTTSATKKPSATSKSKKPQVKSPSNKTMKQSGTVNKTKRTQKPAAGKGAKRR